MHDSFELGNFRFCRDEVCRNTQGLRAELRCKEAGLRQDVSRPRRTIVVLAPRIWVLITESSHSIRVAARYPPICSIPRRIARTLMRAKNRRFGASAAAAGNARIMQESALSECMRIGESTGQRCADASIP
jgi:hypothetical protein